MLELAILGLLEEQSLHGYEIRKRLLDDLGLFGNLSFGSLYPALARLERAGAVETVEEAAATPAIPMTGSLSGERAAFRARRTGPVRSRRARKVYRITGTGRRQFEELLNGEPSSVDDGRDFGLRLAFARYLPPQARLRLLERQRARLTQRLSHARAAQHDAAKRLDAYALRLVEHSNDSTERDISWLDQLIESEKAADTHATSLSNPGQGGLR
jgi:DNA-binding PadR family transcriptional regulator